MKKINLLLQQELQSSAFVVLGCSYPSKIGDGVCHDQTNTAVCNYDGGDCCLNVITDECTECTCYLQGFCETGFHPLVGDGYCNDETNIAECNYDGGDCCGLCIVAEFCSECACLGNITNNVLVGNGFCNDETNNAQCNYDGGDCCSNGNRDDCHMCTCYYQETCVSGFFPSSVGDGFCNNEANIEECSYDFGDCCPSSNLIGNGVCNDETNHPECNFDGGDCCLSNVNRGNCSECSCSVFGVITTPRFPQSYDNYLDLTWLIQVVFGQFIRIDFISFDLGDHLYCR